MPNAFDFTASPFDCLDVVEQRLVRDSVDIAYFREGETLLALGIEPLYLFVVIKGRVSQFDGHEAIASFGPNDCFDGRALVAGRASSRFVAAEEVLAYQLAKATVNDLIARNAGFGALLFSDLSNKLGALSQRHSQREMHALAMSRVEEAFLRPAHVVEGITSIEMRSPDAAGGWWSRLLPGEYDKHALDLKKAGIFPIVHGVRSLALRNHVQPTGTTARLDALVALGRLSQELANDLADSLHFLVGLKLAAGLAELDAGHAVSGAISTGQMSSLERDLLKDALAVVKRFKVQLRHQFHLETA